MGYSLPPYGVCFGDVDTGYTVQDVEAAVSIIAKYFKLIRTYDDFHSTEKYNALMQSTSDQGIDVLLGIPNDKLAGFDANDFLKTHAYQAHGTTPWSNLKCIIVGNETYGSDDKYQNYAPKLEGCINQLITAVKSDNNLKDTLAISCDFGPALHESQDLAACDFTGPDKNGDGQGDYDSSYIVNAMKAILNSGLSTPKMVFGNLYPFYAPFNQDTANLDTPEKMINQYAGTTTGWYPYSASLEAMKKHGLDNLILNCGETGWATEGYNGATQKTNPQSLTMYLQAYKTYIENPGSFQNININEFKGLTTVFFEMFNEPLKTQYPWEPFWGLYKKIEPSAGKAPDIKDGVTIPFKP